MLNLTGVLLMTGLLTASPESPPLNRFEYREVQMGSLFTLVLYAKDEQTANAAARAAFDRVAALNKRLSDYDEQSELSQLCRTSEAGTPVKVSEELFYVLAQARELSQKTEGAFDVTVGPLVQLWRRSRRQRELPSEQRLKEAQPKVGYEKMKLSPDAQTVELLTADMRIDLGGIAKGYAADEALAVLRSRGIDRALLAASGDVVAGEGPPGEKGWRVGIAPLDAEAPSSRFVWLKNQAVSTSGDAFQFVEIGGVTYSHILTPKTGLGLTGRQSVSVVASKGISTDSLASAVSVLGRDEGLKLIDSLPDTAALIVYLDGAGKVQTVASKRWVGLPVELGVPNP